MHGSAFGKDCLGISIDFLDLCEEGGIVFALEILVSLFGGSSKSFKIINALGGILDLEFI